MPKGVPNQLTTMMGILKRDNENLKIRIDQLFDQRHILEMERNSLRADNIALQDNLDLVEGKLAKIQDSYTRLLGWQDCVREASANVFGGKPE